jgi:hypothetical protein
VSEAIEIGSPRPGRGRDSLVEVWIGISSARPDEVATLTRILTTGKARRDPMLVRRSDLGPSPPWPERRRRGRFVGG